jgi:hypothetical protein
MESLAQTQCSCGLADNSNFRKTRNQLICRVCVHAVPLARQLQRRKARELPHLGPYFLRVLARPASQGVMVTEMA